jgi:hypothetical protein
MTRDALITAASRFARPIAMVAALGGTLLFVAGPGCADEGIGDPCTPEQEYNSDFLGFDKKEVSIESKSFQCRTRLCLVNHFQGRVSCPYGQNASGEGPPGTDACKIPGSSDTIQGAKQCTGGDPCKQDSDCPAGQKCDFVNTKDKSLVRAQCTDRKAAQAVYCSCRCADVNGQKPSDQTFCDCPDGFVCAPLVASTGQGNEGLTGSYCIKQHTQYDPTTSCAQGECDPADTKNKCN